MAVFLLHHASHEVTVLVEHVGAGREALDADTVRRRRHVGCRHRDTVAVAEALVDASRQRHAQVTHQLHLPPQTTYNINTIS